MPTGNDDNYDVAGEDTRDTVTPTEVGNESGFDINNLDRLLAAIDYQQYLEKPDRKPKTPRKQLGPPEPLRGNDLDYARWGIIVPEGESVPDELNDLIELRKEQSNSHVPIFEYRPGIKEIGPFLRDIANNVDVGLMDPSEVPYYLCIVAPPNKISWDFQCALDLEYAVGRLWFDDLADMGAYVQHTVTRESKVGAAGSCTGNATPVFFAPDSPPDAGLNGLNTHLVPWLKNDYPNATWLLSKKARRELLAAELAHGKRRFFLTLSHGLEPAYDPNAANLAEHVERLRKRTGAICCQDFSPNTPDADKNLMQALDLYGSPLADADLNGAVWYAMACSSAGTLTWSYWPQTSEEWRGMKPPQPVCLAPHEFITSLPQKCLAAGLGAFLGHVGKTFDYGYLGVTGSNLKKSHTKALINRILNGERIGNAIDHLQTGLGATAEELRRLAETAKQTGAANDRELLAHTLMYFYDRRHLVLLGDPAVRLT